MYYSYSDFMFQSVFILQEFWTWVQVHRIPAGLPGEKVASRRCNARHFMQLLSSEEKRPFFGEGSVSVSSILSKCMQNLTMILNSK